MPQVEEKQFKNPEGKQTEIQHQLHIFWTFTVFILTNSMKPEVTHLCSMSSCIDSPCFTRSSHFLSPMCFVQLKITEQCDELQPCPDKACCCSAAPSGNKSLWARWQVWWITLSVTLGIPLRRLLTVNKVWGELRCCCQGSTKSNVRFGVWRWIWNPACRSDRPEVTIQVSAVQSLVLWPGETAAGLQAWWATFPEEPGGMWAAHVCL